MEKIILTDGGGCGIDFPRKESSLKSGFPYGNSKIRYKTVISATKKRKVQKGTLKRPTTKSSHIKVKHSPFQLCPTLNGSDHFRFLAKSEDTLVA